MNARLQDTQSALSAEQAIGQIAVELPGSTAVFRRLKLDFCCGGQISLREAAAQKSLDVDAILAERRANWKPKAPKYTKGLLKLYSQHAVSPMKGAYME